ncbi:MAG: hypothetical protein IPP14_06620 [Planctomycetes bacterium]|nr:hypothetical protein [Planctomycetota bacterium]
MRPTAILQALTDLCLGALVGISVGASVAAWTIFGVSREQGFDKHVANTLAGGMFDRLGWPVFGLACFAAAGCTLAALRPPCRRPSGATPPPAASRWPWQVMALVSLLIVLCALATQVYFAPAMQDLRANSTWVNGELADPAQKAAFGRMHGFSSGIAGLATVLSAGLLLWRRLAWR